MNNIEMRLFGDKDDMSKDIQHFLYLLRLGDSYNPRDTKLTRRDGSVVYFRLIARPGDSDRLAGMIWNDVYFHSSLLRRGFNAWDEIVYLLSRQRAEPRKSLNTAGGL